MRRGSTSPPTAPSIAHLNAQLIATRVSSMNPNRPVPRASVMEIEAYVPGKSGAPGAKKVYKLSSNETPLGPSPRAVAAFREAAGQLAL